LSGGEALKSLDLPYESFGAFINDSEQSVYDRFIFIPVSHDQALEITEDMRSNASSYYNLFLNNCGNAVENSLRPNGFGFLPSFAKPNNSFDYIKLNTSNLYYER